MVLKLLIVQTNNILQHRHVFGTWEDSMMICVAFKRRGDGGQEPGTGGGNKRMEKNKKFGNMA